MATAAIAICDETSRRALYVIYWQNCVGGGLHKLMTKVISYDHFHDERTGEHLGFIVGNEIRSGDNLVIRHVVDGEVFSTDGQRLGWLSRLN